MFFFCSFFLSTQLLCACEYEEAYIASVAAWNPLFNYYFFAATPTMRLLSTHVLYSPVTVYSISIRGMLYVVNTYIFQPFPITKELCGMKHTKRKSSMWCDTVVWLCLLTFRSCVIRCVFVAFCCTFFFLSLVAFTRLMHGVVRWPFRNRKLTCTVSAYSAAVGGNTLVQHSTAVVNGVVQKNSKKKYNATYFRKLSRGRLLLVFGVMKWKKKKACTHSL